MEEKSKTDSEDMGPGNGDQEHGVAMIPDFELLSGLAPTEKICPEGSSIYLPASDITLQPGKFQA